MSIEKTYSEFMVLHEKKYVFKEIKSLERIINDIIERPLYVLGSDIEEDIKKVTNNLMEEIRNFKKTLSNCGMYEI